MPIKRVTSKSVEDIYIQNLEKVYKGRLIALMIEVGNKCVIDARSKGNYKDQTGALRSSIGFLVLDNGAIVHEAFSNSDSGLMSLNYAKSISGQFNRDGIVLLVSTGCDYAAYLEAKGYNVISSSYLLAEKLTPIVIDSLGLKFRKIL